MKDPTTLPLTLYQVNAELQARIGELLKTGGEYWFEFGQRLVNEGVVEGSAELQELLGTQDWQKLAALPADAFWRQLQQRFGDQQAAAQVIVAAQAAFARGLRDALQGWQRDTVTALDEAGLGLAVPAIDPTWAGLFNPWEPVPPTAAASARAVKKTGAKKAAPKKAAAGSAAKKAAAKKASRPVAKKAGARKAARKAPPRR